MSLSGIVRLFQWDKILYEEDLYRKSLLSRGEALALKEVAASSSSPPEGKRRRKVREEGVLSRPLVADCPKISKKRVEPENIYIHARRKAPSAASSGTVFIAWGRRPAGTEKGISLIGKIRRS